MLFLFQAPPVSWDVEAILQRGRDGRHDTTAAKVKNTESEREWIQTNGKKGPNWLTLHYPLGKGRVQLSMPRGWTWWPSKMNLLFAFNCVSYTFYCLRYSDQLDSCFIMSAGIRVWHIDHLNCFLIKILAGTCRQVCSSVEIKRPSSLSTASTSSASTCASSTSSTSKLETSCTGTSALSETSATMSTSVYLLLIYRLRFRTTCFITE